MKCRDGGHAHSPTKWKMEVIHVEMDEIKLIGSLEDLFEHQGMAGQRFPAGIVQSRSGRPDRHKMRERFGISAGKKRHLVALSDQFLCQIRNHALGATIELRWDAFIQRSDLCNSHIQSPPRSETPYR